MAPSPNVAASLDEIPIIFKPQKRHKGLTHMGLLTRIKMTGHQKRQLIDREKNLN